MPNQLAHHSAPPGAGDAVFPEDWEPVIEERVSPAGDPAIPQHRETQPANEGPAAVRTFHGRIESIGTLQILKALAQSRASGLVLSLIHI